jgi:hypothetical protein
MSHAIVRGISTYSRTIPTKYLIPGQILAIMSTAGKRFLVINVAKGKMMRTDTILDTIQIPSEFVSLAGEWHDGQDSMLYAVSSTGNLSRGSIRPCEDDGYWDESPRRWIDAYRAMTDLEWYRSLYSQLSSEVGRLATYCAEQCHDDSGTMSEFETWCDEQVALIDLEIEAEENQCPA